jgi:hypothetical protein
MNQVRFFFFSALISENNLLFAEPEGIKVAFLLCLFVVYRAIFNMPGCLLAGKLIKGREAREGESYG